MISCLMLSIKGGWTTPARHIWGDHELLQQHQPIQVRSTIFSTTLIIFYSEVPSPQDLLDLSPPPSVGLSPLPPSTASPQTPSTANLQAPSTLSPVLAQTQAPSLPTLLFVPQPPPLLPPSLFPHHHPPPPPPHLL